MHKEKKKESANTKIRIKMPKKLRFLSFNFHFCLPQHQLLQLVSEQPRLHGIETFQLRQTK